MRLYCGFDLEGRRACGSGNFASEAQMKDYLHKSGISDYQIFESGTTYKRGEYKLVTPKELSIFCKQLSVLVYSNVALLEGVQILSEQTDNKQLKLTLVEICGFMGKGYTFAEAMRMYEHVFPAYLLNMLAIGESSGSLDTVLSRMSSYFDNEHKTRKNLRSAVTYPAALTTLMAAVIVLLIVKILPMFDDILKSMGAQMPESSRFIINAGSFLAKYAPPVILIIVVALLAIAFYIRTEKGRLWFDKAKLSIPLYRYIYTRMLTARFSGSLAILLKSGVQLLNALKDVSVITGNKYLKGRLETAADKVKLGEEPVDALSEIGIFPPLFEKLFAVGEKTGNLDEMLEKAASVFGDEADDAIKRFSDILEPLLIILLSIIVGVILLSVMIPIISIINSIG